MSVDVQDQLKEFSRVMVESLPDLDPAFVMDPALKTTLGGRRRQPLWFRPMLAVAIVGVLLGGFVLFVVDQNESVATVLPGPEDNLLAYLDCGDGIGSLRTYGVIGDEAGRPIGVPEGTAGSAETAYNPFTLTRMADLKRIAESEERVVFAALVEERVRVVFAVEPFGGQWVAIAGAFCPNLQNGS